MEKITKEKLENFWYYYKWYVLGGTLLLITLIVGIRSCALKKNPDLYALFAVDKSPNALLVAETELWLSEMAEDLDQDGEKTAKIISVATTDQWNGTSSVGLLVQANSGSAILYILTDSTYNTLHENGLLQQLPGESPYLNGDRYDLTASGALKDIPAFEAEEQSYYLCIRKVAGSTYEGNADHIAQEKLAFSVLEQLIAREAA